ncbi:uncharacterized protein UTRI_02020_B [Ustilago trichophora]|uniref:Uncharacterized protein n=1 Tax=Ustilago trichophora TaxID=86804 RepID=A0A5C3DU82_9BASI|nr:uncharacterized protein UTRI_02020_B [Ustilago trichophora]
MAATTSPAPVVRPVAQSNNRRNGWVIASEDDTEIERPSSFDARRSAAAWNKGKGPSQASIPSRASSLASPTPSPTILSAPFPPTVTDAPSTSGSQAVPPPRVPSSSMGHGRETSSGSTTEGESSSGRRRPSPPLLVPPKQTYRKVPSTRVLPASAYSDHQKFMATANKAPRPASASSSAGSSGSRPPVALRSDLALLAASRRANHSSSSSATSTGTTIQSTSTPASSVASTTPTDSQAKGKGKQIVPSPLQRDEEGFFTSGKTVQQLVETYNGVHRDSQQTEHAHNDRIQPKSSLLFSVHPLPALSEKSANSDLDDALSSTSENVSDTEGTNMAGARPGKRRDSLRIELPPPPAQFKDRYPSIMVDSTHASDSEASGTSNGGPRRRRRRSTASTSNRLGGDAEDDDDDDYADDDSSWPSTPSTTPLEMYFTSADARPKAARKTVQTTKEIIAPDSNALGMGRPMVVVTSPSTASEVSSDRRSSSGSGSTSDRTYSSSPPAVASVAPAPALSKIEEHPSSRTDVETSGPPRRSLSFELPAVQRTRASDENLPIAAPVRSPSRAKAFFAKISPSRSNNRSSTDLASTTARPDASAVSADLAKRISLESQQRTSAEQRRSVELRPILLNAASRPSPRVAAAELPVAGPSSASSSTAAQQVQQRRRSSGRVPIRPNVVPYHSRRSSEVSVGSSNESPLLQDRGSFDKEASDPRYSPSSVVTTLTMPSPALTDQKRFSPQAGNAGHSPATTSDRHSSAANTPKDRFAASMPSLHQPPQRQQPPSRRSPSHEEPESRPSAIRLLVDSQKGRMTRDNDSIAEWISVSVNDLPLPDGTQAYGNGGAGEFSNEKQQAGKKIRKNKPWKLGRFAASEVVLPAKTSSASPAMPTKRRSISLVKRASSAQVNESTRASGDSSSSPHKGPFMRNLGFTTANRNVVLQNLCAERSISALAASTIYIAGCGRINVPQPGPLPTLATKSKQQEKNKAQERMKSRAPKDKRQSKRMSKQEAVPVVQVPSNAVSPSHSAEEARDAYLNVTEDRHTGYDLSGAGVGTVKSMVPETGDWSGSSDHVRVPDQEAAVVVQPFRDYEDEGSDLFDSDGSESESEDEMDYEDEDVEVPVRFGQRVNLANRTAFGSGSPQMRSSAETTHTLDSVSRPVTAGRELDFKPVTPSVSLERLTPGTVVLHGSELRICVEDEMISARNAAPLAYWKAVEVQHVNDQPSDASHVAQQTGGQVRRQPSSRAMKLEQEVATGMFAAFVGNRSPRRQAHRGSFDAGCNSGQGSPKKQQPTNVKELLVSKVNKSAFYVRSELRSTAAGEEQVVEITRRMSGSRGLSHTKHSSSRESSQAGVPSEKLERAFPSPLLSKADFAYSRTRSNRIDGSQASLDGGESERVTVRIQRAGGRGFMASLETHDGQQWVWHGSKLEASVMSPSRDHESSSKGLDALDGYDLSLRTHNGQETVELATYSTDSQVRNALGLFKPRTKAVPKPLPEDESSLGPAVPPAAQVLPLAIPFRGAGVMMRAEPQVPRRGIRGGPLLRPHPTAAGSAARHHGLWQHQRAAISSEAVVQVHNNAVNNARASLQIDRPGSTVLGSGRTSADMARSSQEQQQRHETAGNKRMGQLNFCGIESLDRDLVVLSLLAVMGAARV